MITFLPLFCCFLIIGLCKFTGCLGIGSINNWEMDKQVTDDIRCFCNLPQCIVDSYMCRTARSGSQTGCFSEVKDVNWEFAARYGCVDLLARIDQHVQCDNIPWNHVSNGTQNISTKVLLLCCQEDMCNHVDSVQNKKSLEEKAVNSNRFQSLDQEQNSKVGINVPMLLSPGINKDESWFRVATIVVPICGAVILFSLIAIAIKILRSERLSSTSYKLDSNNDFNKNYSSDSETPMVKISNEHNLFNTNNSFNIDVSEKKNETRAKLNQLVNSKYSLLPQSCCDSNIKTNNINKPNCSNAHKNINSSLNSWHYIKENSSKLYEKEGLSPITVNWNSQS